jgi:NAD(P)-dependent dehydrogenase (short-subunit alcohol dehydrogenase family)
MQDRFSLTLSPVDGRSTEMAETRNLFTLAKQVAVITGGCSGIGSAIASGFVSAGASVVVVDIADAQAKPPGTDYVRADVSDETEIQKVSDEVRSKYGQVHILVNNAGIAEFSLSMDLSRQEWDRILSVNLTGAFNCSQAFGRHMSAQRYGRIINLASRCGFVGLPFHPAYNASKAGIVSLTQTLAVEWGGFNINVNAIVPGFVRTPMNAKEMEDEDMTAVYAKKIPLGRISEPSDLVGAAIFLASPASNYVTGAIIPVDGGNLASGGLGAEIRNEHFRKLGISTNNRV